jgi:hypothetical protein
MVPQRFYTHRQNGLAAAPAAESLLSISPPNSGGAELKTSGKYLGVSSINGLALAYDVTENRDVTRAFIRVRGQESEHYAITSKACGEIANRLRSV